MRKDGGAVGVDAQTGEDYAANPEQNLTSLDQAGLRGSQFAYVGTVGKRQMVWPTWRIYLIAFSSWCLPKSTYALHRINARLVRPRSTGSPAYSSKCTVAASRKRRFRPCCLRMPSATAAPWGIPLRITVVELCEIGAGGRHATLTDARDAPRAVRGRISGALWDRRCRGARAAFDAHCV